MIKQFRIAFGLKMGSSIGGWGVSPTGKSQWSLHACDPVAGVEPENSPPGRARAGVPLGSEQ